MFNGQLQRSGCVLYHTVYLEERMLIFKCVVLVRIFFMWKPGGIYVSCHVTAYLVWGNVVDGDAIGLQNLVPDVYRCKKVRTKDS